MLRFQRRSWSAAAACLFALLLCPGCESSSRRVAPPQPPSRIAPGELPAALVRVSLFVADSAVVTCRAPLSVRSGPHAPASATLSADSTWVITYNTDGWRAQRRGGPESVALGNAGEVILVSEGDAAISVGPEIAQPYRGSIRLAALSPGRMRVVNDLDLESYLWGVVGVEAYASWPMDALRAQAIASRTYALWRINQRAGRDTWDLGSDQASQVYRGITAETARVIQAVRETRGVVLTEGPRSQERIFPTYYSSVCGGHTADAQDAFGGNEPAPAPLRGVPCPYCAAAAPAHLLAWGEVALPEREVSEGLLARYGELAALDRIVDVQVARRGAGGRVAELLLRGANGRQQAIGAERFRLALTKPERPIRSSWYRLIRSDGMYRISEGRGFGHGVGMCQWGVKAMADQGFDAVAIVKFYYSGAYLVRVY